MRMQYTAWSVELPPIQRNRLIPVFRKRGTRRKLHIPSKGEMCKLDHALGLKTGVTPHFLLGYTYEWVSWPRPQMR